MERRASLLLSAPAVTAALLVATPASADDLKPDSGAGQIDGISDGISELSLESIFVLGFDERGAANDFRMSLIVGPTFRYFFARNAVLGFNGAFLYKVADGQVSSSDLGGALTVHIGYMLSLGNGMFLKPLFGLGGFYAQRGFPVNVGGVTQHASTASYGGLLRPGLDLVFYSGSHFNFFVGPEFMISLGGSSETVVSGVKINGEFFTSVDGGFNAGVSYVF